MTLARGADGSVSRSAGATSKILGGEAIEVPVYHAPNHPITSAAIASAMTLKAAIADAARATYLKECQPFQTISVRLGRIACNRKFVSSVVGV